MGGGSARRRANEAAEKSKREAQRLRGETDALQRRTRLDTERAQQIMIRSLRARGGGVFESDFAQRDTLG